MIKRFPALRALGGRSYADEYADSRKASQKTTTPSPNLKKLTPSSVPLKFGPADTAPPPTGFLYMLAVFGIILVAVILLEKFYGP
ncbi:MAG: hypothetical protein ACJAVK_000729 [Akkermansiaceae bacterium]|jgi:hypothetical protein